MECVETDKSASVRSSVEPFNPLVGILDGLHGIQQPDTIWHIPLAQVAQSMVSAN